MLQTQIKENIEDVHKDNVRAHDVLNRISKSAGHSTLDDYVKAAFKLLSEEDRKNFSQK